MGGDEVKDSDMVTDNCRRIAKETSKSLYRWDSKGVGKTEIVVDGNSVDYN